MEELTQQMALLSLHERDDTAKSMPGSISFIQNGFEKYDCEGDNYMLKSSRHSGIVPQRHRGESKSINNSLTDSSRAVSRPIRKNKRPKLSLAEILHISQKFVRSDAIQHFSLTWKRTILAWASLLQVTTMPSNVPITNFNVVAAVQAIDSVIEGGTELPSKFGYVQFFKFVESLKSRVQAEKALGFIQPTPSVGNASHAYEIYRMAQNVAHPLEQLRHRKRVGCRMNQLASYALLLIVFSNKADSIA